MAESGRRKATEVQIPEELTWADRANVAGSFSETAGWHHMIIKSGDDLTFARLPDIPPDEIITHMSDPRVARHMPLLTSKWDLVAATKFVAAKEESWERDGLGHWAILCNGSYVGWGGFQKEGDEWDFGLVLKLGSLSLGYGYSRKPLRSLLLIIAFPL